MSYLGSLRDIFTTDIWSIFEWKRLWVINFWRKNPLENYITYEKKSWDIKHLIGVWSLSLFVNSWDVSILFLCYIRRNCSLWIFQALFWKKKNRMPVRFTNLNSKIQIKYLCRKLTLSSWNLIHYLKFEFNFPLGSPQSMLSLHIVKLFEGDAILNLPILT